MAEILQELDPQALAQGLSLLSSRQGAEHLVHFGDRSGRVIKLTNPGELGAGDLGLSGYLRRMAWSNECLGDDVRIEGWVIMPNEVEHRLVLTQMEHFPDPVRPEPTKAEIDAFMRYHGFLKAYDGAYIHESRDMVASDAVPKNFVRARGGRIHVVDVILTVPSASQLERLTSQAYNLPQVPKQNME